MFTKSHLLLTLTALLLSWQALAPRAAASEMAAGFAAVEEGDDRMRPAATLHLGFGDTYVSRLYYYGRQYGPVKEETFLLSFGRKFPLFQSKSLNANVGLALMNERTSLKFSAPDNNLNKVNNQYNVGLDFGVSWSLPKGISPLYFGVAWDAHVFAAGLEGLIFLSTGRKETVSCLAGVML